MNPFANYLPCYAPGTVPERPWWRVVREPFTDSEGFSGWIEHTTRTDGARLTHATMEDYDAAHPLPVPPVLAGQVWANDYGGTVAIISHHPTGQTVCADETDLPLHLVRFAPSLYRHLVWGPLAPWAPVGWRP